MTYKELVSFLNQYRKAMNEIKSLKEQIAEIEYSKYSFGNWLASLPEGSSNQEKYLAILRNEDEMIRRLEKKSERLNLIAENIEDEIDKISDPTSHNILRLRFINGYSLKEISGEIKYDYDYTRKLSKRALGEVMESIKEKPDTK